MICGACVAFGCILLLLILSYLFLKVVIQKTKRYDLKGAHVLVTGGSSGIGKAVAEEVVRLGASVTLLARNKARLEEAKHSVQGHMRDATKQRVVCVVGDVSADYNDVKTAVEQAERELGPVDVLVNSAGMSLALRFDETKIEEFQHVMNANYLGSVRTTRAVITQMKKRRTGVIVYVSSMAGQMGVYGYTAYSASKFALRGLAESLQMEVKPYNVQVMLAFPPDTNTPMFHSENTTKPEETTLISESGGYFEPDVVAKRIVQDIKKGKFLSYQGFDGLMLALLTCGMAPAASAGEALLQVFGMGIVRLVSLGYLFSFHRIIARCYRKKTEQDVVNKSH